MKIEVFDLSTKQSIPSNCIVNSPFKYLEENQEICFHHHYQTYIIKRLDAVIKTRDMQNL